MRVLVFDTETTGLPPSRYPPSESTISKWPYVVQLSFVIYDTSNKKTLCEHDYIISLPKGVEIPEKAKEIHGISSSISKNRGYSMASILEIFTLCVNQCQCVVAHNIDFDLNMIDVECKRHNQANPFSSEKIYYCTMNKTTKLCNILREYRNPGPNGDVRLETFVKKPTLTELHYHLFQSKPTGVHNSMIDVRVCLRCFLKVVFDYTLHFTQKELSYL